MTEPTTYAPRGNATTESLAQTVDFPITRPFEQLIERLGPQAVFGDPIRNGDTVVIPVAEVRTGFGFGGGQDRENQNEGGGGAGVRVTPRGYIYVTGDRVHYRRIRRFGPLAWAGLALTAGLVAFFAPIWRP